jgi:TolB-like protein/DNA-binding winged helix-turn-helix (wHTH) protein
MSHTGKGCFEFCGYTLDLGTRTLSNGEHDISLRPKSFDVLAHLVGNAGALVARDELIAAVWPGVIASDESLSRCISDVRAALGDSSRQLVRTVPGRGYQFAAEVTRAPASVESEPSQAVTDRHLFSNWRTVAVSLFLIILLAAAAWIVFAPDEASAPTDRPSIAVLPFRNISGAENLEPFATGLTSDLITSLARVPEMLVISENSTRQYKDKVVDVSAVGNEMNVAHVLSGTIQGSRERVRIGVQLSETESGSAIWSQRYDRDIDDFLELQDDIVRRVLIGLQIELTHGETVRVLSRGTENLEAWLLNLEGIAEGFQFKLENNLKARELFSAAAKIDPDWAAPVSGIAWTYREAIRRGWTSNVEADRKQWLELARRCEEIDSQFYGCFIQLGNYHIENGRVEEGIALREKALALAPNDLSALSGLAWQLVLVGQVDRGLELLDRAKLVSPLHPGWLIATEAYAFQMNGQHDKAIEGFRYALAHGNFPDWHARLAAAYADAGDMENAKKEAQVFREKRPNRTVADLTRILRIQDPERTKRYADLLRKLGIPD